MTNTITINGQNIAITEEQFAQLQAALGLKQKLLAEAEIGSIVTIAGIEWIVLEHFNGRETLCLTKDFICVRKFDDCTNNYAESEIRKYLNGEFLEKLAYAVNDDRIVSAKINLTPDDGLDDYGFVCDKVGLLTDTMYRKHNRTIRKYSVKNWWWTATPYSTKANGYYYSVRCVNGSGTLIDDFCALSCGVRPFCIFKSCISVF